MSDVNYYLSASDHVTGPYEKEELIDSLKYGIISPDATICEVGTDDWQPISVLTGKKMELAVSPQPTTLNHPTLNHNQLPKPDANSIKIMMKSKSMIHDHEPSTLNHQLSTPETPFTQLQDRTGAPISVTNNYYQTKSAGTAVLLEILPGIFFQTFGIGNLYAGNITTGLILMLTYWATCVVNFFLLFLLIGFITWPLTFIAYLIISIISAQKAAERASWQTIMNGTPPALQ